jgi:hypothetical protein
MGESILPMHVSSLSPDWRATLVLALITIASSGVSTDFADFR